MKIKDVTDSLNSRKDKNQDSYGYKGFKKDTGQKFKDFLRRSGNKGSRVRFLYVLLIVAVAVFYYIDLPPIHYASFEFWNFLFIVTLAVLAIEVLADGSSLLRPLRSGTEAGQGKQYSLHLPLKFKLLIYPWPILLVISLLTNLIVSPIFMAGPFSSMIDVQTKSFQEDFPETNMDQITLVDRDTAERLGNRQLGALTDLVSQFEAAKDYTQISKAGQPFRVTPLEYAGFFKWLNNFSQGIPNYLAVDNVTGKVTVETPAQPIKYSYSDKFNRNVLRKLRFAFPFMMFDRPSFEIDDQGNPYYIATTYGRYFFLKEPKVTGLVTLNAMTGETQKYSLDEIPSWVDRVYSSDLILHQLTLNGTYKNGYWNSLFAKKGVTEPTDGYNYLAIGDDLYLYTGITSVVADDSNIGFVLVNLRTKEATMYPLTAAEEFSAMASAEGSVQETSYKATFPLLINIQGRPLYILTLKDNSGLIKEYALVDAQDYQEVYTAKSVKQLLTDYASVNQVADDNLLEEADLEEIKGAVDDIKATVVDGNTVYYFMVDGKVYQADLSLSDQLPFVENGADLEFKANKDGKVTQILGDYANSRQSESDQAEGESEPAQEDPLSQNLEEASPSESDQ